MPADADVVDQLSRVVVRLCRALAEAGRPAAAGRLAADAWAVVRKTHAGSARRLDGAMHYTARLEQQLERTSGASGGSQPVPVDVRTTDRKADRMSTEERILDVRSEIPKRRHELIFDTFAELAPGAAYVLVNDHDPKPLRYQLEAENAGEFSWQYLEEGPDVWRVRIGRTAVSPRSREAGAR